MNAEDLLMELKEIERKFLVKNEEYRMRAYNHYSIIQGYLNSNPERSVRVRVRDNKGFITVKGLADWEGTTRFEWEKEISVKEARALLELCEPNLIVKERYLVKDGEHHIIEVDEFSGANQGLVIAEIELKSEEEYFKKPGWLGEEVTGDCRYYNSELSKRAFKTWNDAGLFPAQ